MSYPRQNWLASVFVLLGLASIAGLVLLASGRVRIDNELLGLGVGVMVILLLWLGMTRR